MKRAVPFKAVQIVGAVVLVSSIVAGCQTSKFAKHLQPLAYATTAKMSRLGMDEHAPIMMRIYKQENQLEVWKKRKDGQFALLKSYKICKFSGKLGPKKKEGDRQSPEGFYWVSPGLMNPKSSYYLSFNLGYPNPFDRAYGRTGSNLMVHGDCSSRGCYAMTDEQMGEIYALARDAFRGGQKRFQVQAFPFRMTAENFAKHRDNVNMPFWRNLKTGADHFAVSKQPPVIAYCNRKYVFNPENSAGFSATGACPSYQVTPSLQAKVLAKQQKDDATIKVMVAELVKQETEEAAKAKALAEAAEKAKNQPKSEGLFAGLLGSDDKTTAPAGGQGAIANLVPPRKPTSGTSGLKKVTIPSPQAVIAQVKPVEKVSRVGGFFQSVLNLGRGDKTETTAPQPLNVPVPPPKP